MNATETATGEKTAVELTARQHELLMRGLKFVRSSVALNMEVPSDDLDAARSRDYEELDALESQLETSKPSKPR